MIYNKKTFKCVINGIEQEFEILYTFKSFKTNKDDENNSLNIFSSIYYPQSPEKELENIEDEDDWNEVEKFLNNVSGDKNE